MTLLTDHDLPQCIHQHRHIDGPAQDTDRLPSRLAHRYADVHPPGFRALVVLDIADKDSPRAPGPSGLPSVLVSLHEVARAVAFGDGHALRVRHEDFDLARDRTDEALEVAADRVANN